MTTSSGRESHSDLELQDKGCFVVQTAGGRGIKKPKLMFFILCCGLVLLEYAATTLIRHSLLLRTNDQLQVYG